MEKLRFVLLSLFFVLRLAGTSLADLDNNLIAHYPLDGNAVDVGPGGYDGTEVRVSWSEDAVSGGSALLLEGRGAFVDLGNHIQFEYDQPFSISFWMKPAHIRKGIILSKKERFRKNTGWLLRMDQRNHLVMEIVARKRHNKIHAQTRNAYTDLNNYYHVVVTYNGSRIGTGIRIYVDGKRQATNSRTIMMLIDSIQNDASLKIGAGASKARKRHDQFKGLIDEVSFFSSQLTAEEIKELYYTFYGGGLMADEDGDGVPNTWDQCPNTQPGLPVCSDGCAASSCGVPGDTQPPFNGSISINNGSSATETSLVHVRLSAEDDFGVVAFFISEDANVPGPDNPGWNMVLSSAEFSKSMAHALSTEEGSKILYAWFKDASGNVSEASQASITLSYFKLPDTGQKQSYTVTLGEDSDYDGYMPSLTNLSAETTRDNNTKLVWQRKDDQVSRDHETATLYCESLELDGYSDWRLPTVKELTTIIDFDEAAPAINEAHFSHTAVNAGSYYWTSTVHPEDADKYFNIDFRFGTINTLNSSSRANHVKCVRGNQAPYSLTKNGDGSVTDNITGLVWEQDSAGPMNWENAIAYCENRNTPDGRYWRLPNFKELEYLRDNTRYSPYLDPDFFPNAATHYWSSTTSVFMPTLAYVSNFEGTVVSTYSGKMASYYVKCVQKK